MKSVAALSILVASAAAFAPQQTSRASTSLAAFENELGAQPPLGFWVCPSLVPLSVSLLQPHLRFCKSYRNFFVPCNFRIH
jgi:hypothetical protein